MRHMHDANMHEADVKNWKPVGSAIASVRIQRKRSHTCNAGTRIQQRNIVEKVAPRHNSPL
eukprot:6280773-Pyramimonas_sp.AAC.1